MGYELGPIGIFVRNLERAKRFYTEVLDLELLGETGRNLAVLRPKGGPLVLLQLEPEMLYPGVRSTGIEVGFGVPDLDEAWEMWQEHAPTFDAKTVAKPGELALGRTFIGRDPDGHRLRIYELKPGYGFSDAASLERISEDMQKLLETYT